MKLYSFLLENKTLKQTIFKNTFWLSFSEIIARFLKFILLIYVARILGATEYGRFSFALDLVAILIIFADLGTGTIITRELAKDLKKEKDYLHSLFSLRIFLTLFTLFLINLIAIFITPDIKVKRVIFLLSFYGIFSSFFDFANSFFRARQRMEYEAIGKILNSVFCVGLGFLFLQKIPSIITLSYAYLIGIFIATLSLFWILQKKFIPFGFKIDKIIWKEFLSLSWPLAFIAIFASVYHYMDTVMLGAWGFMKETGWYNAAYRIIDILIIPAILISLSFFPVTSKSFKIGEKEEKKKKIFLSQLSILTALAIPLIMGGVVLAPQIINFLYGKEYRASILALQILIITAGIIYLSHPFYRTLIAANLQKTIFWITFSGALLNMILNFLLIPKYTLYGAAVATLISYFLVFLLYLIFLKKKTSLSPFNKKYHNILIVSLSASLLMIFLISQISVLIKLNIILLILIGAIFYSVCIFLFNKIFKLELI